MIHEDLNIRTKKDDIYEEVIFIIRYLTSKGFYAVGDQSDDDTVERIMKNEGGWIEFAKKGETFGKILFVPGNSAGEMCADYTYNADLPSARRTMLSYQGDIASQMFETYEKVRQIFHRPLYS